MGQPPPAKPASPASTQAERASGGAQARKRGLTAMPSLPPAFDIRRLRAIAMPSDSPGWLSGMRVRKKLIVLHTTFWLLLAGVLLLTLQRAMSGVLREAEGQRALSVLRASEDELARLKTPELEEALDRMRLRHGEAWRWRVGSASEVGLTTPDAARLVELGERGTLVESSANGPSAAMRVSERGATSERFVVLATPSTSLREEVTRLYVFTIASLLVVYGLVVLALELLVLPKGVYMPIRRLLRADEAVQLGRSELEIIPEQEIPGDELGSIMRSRNDTVTRLRTQERQTTAALMRVEEIAGDLKRKNELLEAAQRNLADADRLAALGVLSAGIAHELNTPLAVVKGLAEKVQRGSTAGTGLNAAEAALLVRVVGRLERLSDSLLDYARVRPPRVALTRIAGVVDEAVTLVKLDREASAISIRNEISPELLVSCDADRMTQVFVNLLRNSVDALGGVKRAGVIRIRAEIMQRETRSFASLKVCDNGPGIAPQVLARMFEPFVTTRLDAKGTGLGLAVAEGIVREHGGVLAAKNRTAHDDELGSVGASFEVLLPLEGTR